ncbi:MAG: tryptophan 2,3-dioxygenase family protein [Phycisphaerales bacterium]
MPAQPSTPASALDSAPRLPLLYSTYIGDEQIVKALDMAGVPPLAPEGTPQADIDRAWPVKPPNWQGDQPWPTADNWVHDEALFIRTHQAFEVWFALIIHELSSVIGEATGLLGGPGNVPDPRPADRVAGNAPFVPDAARWPSATRALRDAIARDPAIEPVLATLWIPAQRGVGTHLASGQGESAAFDQALGRWTQRLDRAAKALACTLPFFDVLMTMTPANFLAFRGRLQPASGFGSAQFREIEYLLGLRELNEPKLAPSAARFGADEREKSQTWSQPAFTAAGQPLAPLQRPTAQTPRAFAGNMFYVALTDWGRSRVAARARGASLRDVVYGLLDASFSAASRPDGPEDRLPDMRPPAVDAFLALCLRSLLDDQYRNASGGRLDASGVELLRHSIQTMNEAIVNRETVAAALIDAHPAKERFATFLDSCLGVDRALLQWRDRHIRFVEGMIGTRAGTGGGGVRYLRGTVSTTPIYKTHGLPCLWQARSFVQGLPVLG